jgi:hypothetical protein
MENLGLVFEPDAPSLAETAALLGVPGPATPSSNEIEVRDGGDYVIVRRDDPNSYDTAPEVFERWPPEFVPARVGFATIDYHDLALAKQVVLALAKRYSFWVDTDFGEVYTTEAFKARCRAEPDWVWWDTRDPETLPEREDNDADAQMAVVHVRWPD